MKEQFSLRLESTDKKKIKIIAAREKRTLNSLIEYIVSCYIRDFERINGKIITESDDVLE